MKTWGIICTKMITEIWGVYGGEICVYRKVENAKPHWPLSVEEWEESTKETHPPSCVSPAINVPTKVVHFRNMIWLNGYSMCPGPRTPVLFSFSLVPTHHPLPTDSADSSASLSFSLPHFLIPSFLGETRASQWASITLSSPK